MRVVHVITRLIVGGAQENTLFNCEDLLHRHGDDVTLICGPTEGPEGDLFDRAAASGLPIERAPDLIRPIRPARDVRGYRQLRRLLRRLEPDVVHTHSAKGGILGRAAAAHVGVPAIVHSVHGLSFHPFQPAWKNRLYITAERTADRWTDRYICVADAMTAQSLAVGIGTPDRYVTIQSGMNVEPFLDPPHDRDAVRRRLGLPPDALVVGKVARLFELKGHDDVLDAAVPLAREFPALRLLFVGGGTWRDRLERRAEELGLAGRVHFTGLVPPAEIPELLHATDLVVHASYREGLARVLPQALISARPVVSYDVDGAREVVLPDVTGELVPPADVAGLTAALRKLLADPARRVRYGEEGRRRFTELFRHERMTERIRAFYEQTLSGPRRRVRR